MSDSRLRTYNALHHDCQTMGELHSLSDAMRHELVSEIADLKSANLPREPIAGAGDDWADDQWRQMTKPVTAELGVRA